MKKLVDIERQCWENAQYSRRECLEVAGIPASIPQQNLEEKVCQIFEAIGVSVDKNDIYDCHRLRNKEQTIFKFFDARTANRFFDAKKICEAST